MIKIKGTSRAFALKLTYLYKIGLSPKDAYAFKHLKELTVDDSIADILFQNKYALLIGVIPEDIIEETENKNITNSEVI